ncbi:universal stress protein [Muriicola sp. Z0-33]|uniref:universal stress protein n=1 Tax=Muriicola sp. Z0-33 TaxID=2816957 RepID=UPI002237F596|nr:universal stress protein [Muriicola sp. Z0-33]MCW5515767.1 universal stress protein [Muriicola sp. Z0-33]
MLRILLPTDFSDNSLNAIRYALTLFKTSECTFYLLHTYTPAIYRAEYVLHSPAQYGLGDMYQSASETQLENFLETIKKEFDNPKHTFSTHTAFNTLVEEVNEFVDHHGIDIIVMGTQGATGAKEIFIGTHTVHVIKRAKVPVLAIPPEFAYEQPKEILFPTDYEVDYKKEPLRMLLHIAQEHMSSIEVLHASYGYELSDPQKKNKAKLDGILSQTAHLFHDWSNQEVIEAINKFQLKHKSHMLVMIQNKHTFVERLFIEPVIKKISFHITIPFMVIPHFK